MKNILSQSLLHSLQKSAGEGRRRTFYLNLVCITFLTNLLSLNLKRKAKALSFCHLTVYCSRGDEKTFGWAFMIPMSHLSFVQCELKFRPKKNDKMKVYHGVVAVGIVGGGGGRGGIHVMSHMT